MVLVLCVGLGVVPVEAEETPGVLRPEAEPTPFFLLPDRTLESPGTENEESERKSRDWLGLGRDTVFLLGYQITFIGILYLLPESVSLIATDPIGALNSAFERLMGIKSDIRVDVGRDSEVHVQLRFGW